MKLYTKTGDDGTTGLVGGGRVSKTDMRVVAYGDVDELNAVIGWCAAAMDAGWRDQLQLIQADLFLIGAELASADAGKLPASFVPIGGSAVARLEGWIDQASTATAQLTCFILPGGSEGGGRLHMARAVCRRAERAVVALSAGHPVNVELIKYLNRLSDLLFAWARQYNQETGAGEIPWKP